MPFLMIIIFLSFILQLLCRYRLKRLLMVWLYSLFLFIWHYNHLVLLQWQY